MGARLGSSWCTAWSGCVHGSVATHGLVAMHVRIVHGLNFMDDWAMCLNYKNGHMQLKNGTMQLKAMQLKVGMEKNIGEKRINKGPYMFSLSFL